MNRLFYLILLTGLPFYGFSQEADDWGFWQSEPEIGEYVGPEEDLFPAEKVAETSPAASSSMPESAAPETRDEAPVENRGAGDPWGFGNLRLGMSMADVKTVLSQSRDFSYRHFTESMLPYTELPVFECKGTRFIDRAVFQFYEDRLYSMTVFFNRRKIDFYTLFTTLTEQYGPHSELNPSRIVWDNGSSRMTLLKPLTLSFLDAAVHRELLDQSEIRKDSEYFRKQEFLRQFGFPNRDTGSENTGESEVVLDSETAVKTEAAGEVR